MTHKMISEQERVPVVNKPWATRKDRNGRYNFQPQTKSAAVQTVSCAMHTLGGKWQNAFSEITVYKLEGNEYVRVFDSHSDVANLFTCGALTKDQVLARIFEE